MLILVQISSLTIKNSLHACVDIQHMCADLTHCGLMTPYGIIPIGVSTCYLLAPSHHLIITNILRNTSLCNFSNFLATNYGNVSKNYIFKMTVTLPGINVLTHWGQATHICIGKLTIIGSDNGLSPGRRQAIIWTNAGILLIGHLGTNFSEILIEIHTFSFKKIDLNMSSAKWRPFCPSLNVLTQWGWNKMTDI